MEIQISEPLDERLHRAARATVRDLFADDLSGDEFWSVIKGRNTRIPDAPNDLVERVVEALYSVRPDGLERDEFYHEQALAVIAAVTEFGR